MVLPDSKISKKFIGGSALNYIEKSENYSKWVSTVDRVEKGDSCLERSRVMRTP